MDIFLILLWCDVFFYSSSILLNSSVQNTIMWLWIFECSSSSGKEFSDTHPFPFGRRHPPDRLYLSLKAINAYQISCCDTFLAQDRLWNESENEQHSKDYNFLARWRKYDVKQKTKTQTHNEFICKNRIDRKISFMLIVKMPFCFVKIAIAPTYFKFKWWLFFLTNKVFLMKSWSKSLNRIFETKNKESDKETKTLNGQKVVKLHLIAKELEKRVWMVKITLTNHSKQPFNIVFKYIELMEWIIKKAISYLFLIISVLMLGKFSSNWK